MTDQTLTALFANHDDARRAAEALRGLGLREDQVAIVGREALASHLGGRAGAAATDDDPARIADPPSGGPELVRILTAQGLPERQAEACAEGLRRGGVLVVVHTEAGMAGRVIAVLDHYGPAELDRRAAEFHAAGWTRFDEAAGPYGAVQISDDLLGTEPVGPAGPTPAEDRLHEAAGRLRAASTAPEPGSAAGGVQAKLARTPSHVTGTPSPAQSEPPEVGGNKPGAQRPREDESR